MQTKESAAAFVLFELAGTAYAVSSDHVQQLEMVEHVTPVPRAPAFVDGVVFVRGQVVPVVNLRSRFGLERISYDLKTRLLIVSVDGRTVGLLVDSAREFITLGSDAISPPPEAVSGLSGNYLTGIAHVNNRVVLLLSIEEIMAFHDLTNVLES